MIEYLKKTYKFSKPSDYLDGVQGTVIDDILFFCLYEDDKFEISLDSIIDSRGYMVSVYLKDTDEEICPLDDIILIIDSVSALDNLIHLLKSMYRHIRVIH